mmetsp:Transcript_5456/g.7369  ORF Transcript_5456/g.7369 Transcript_5456/m.7369 type:complete len:84 (+) Transcript_5456:79-330(+)
MGSNTLQQTKSFAALTSVAANKRMYTKRCQNISNCPVTSSTFQIYGPNSEALVGKTTRRPRKTVELPSNDRYPVFLVPYCCLR